MEERNKSDGKQQVKGKKVGGKHRKMGKNPPVFKKKKDSKSTQLKAAIDSLAAQYEAIDSKNIKKFRSVDFE